MLKNLLLAACLLLTAAAGAQVGNIGIGTATPAASAALEIRDAGKGLLIPRLSTAQRTAIQNPAEGLMVFDSTVNAFFYASAANTWTRVGDNLGNHTATQAINTNGNTISNNGSANGITLDNSGNATVTGKVTANGGLAIGGTGAANYDFYAQGTNGNVGIRKGFGAQSIRYIMAVVGTYPFSTTNQLDVTILGEVKMFAGIGQVPGGWMLCEGQILPIAQYAALFSILGTTYGGNGQSTFALPDLRGATPVGPGTSPAGYNWVQGQRTN